MSSSSCSRLDCQASTKMGCTREGQATGWCDSRCFTEQQYNTRHGLQRNLQLFLLFLQFRKAREVSAERWVLVSSFLIGVSPEKMDLVLDRLLFCSIWDICVTAVTLDARYSSFVSCRRADQSILSNIFGHHLVLFPCSLAEVLVLILVCIIVILYICGIFYSLYRI